jgi:DNA-binding beta-propeller fold protein YncE
MHVMQATPRDLRRSNPHSMRTALTGVLCVLAGALAAACTASAADVRPPSDQLFFPSGVALSPDESVLFVANANSELRYDSGTISVFDVMAINNAIANPPSECQRDPDHSETLVCDEAQFLRPDAGVRIGNFATDIGVQKLDPGQARLFVPTRGDPSVAWANYDGANLSCGSSSGGFALCDDAHRLTSVNIDPNAQGVTDEPFGVFVDSDHGFAVVTHQTNGEVTLIDSPKDIASTAVISDVKYNVFAADIATGLRGATGVTGRKLPLITLPDGKQLDNELIYVGSRTEDRIQTFTVTRPENDAPPYLLANQFFFLDSVGTNPGVGGSIDTRGMQISADSNRLYLVNRRPPTLQVFDTSIGPEGTPRNVAVAASDICREASTLVAFGIGDAERVYVTCFLDGQIYVVDPRGQSQVEDIFTVGRGPYAIVGSPMHNKLFITNFLEDTIAVVDVDPTSSTRNRVVLRIGVPKAP